MEEARLREQEVGVGSGWQQGTGREAGRRGCGRLPLTTCWLSLQELSKREVVAVGHLEVPAELAGLMQAVAGVSTLGSGGRYGHKGTATSCSPLPTGLRLAKVPRVAPVRTPRLQAEPRVTLPLDINNYPMAKFVRCHFKVRAGTGQGALASGHWPVGSDIVLTLGRLPWCQV